MDRKLLDEEMLKFKKNVEIAVVNGQPIPKYKKALESAYDSLIKDVTEYASDFVMKTLYYDKENESFFVNKAKSIIQKNYEGIVNAVKDYDIDKLDDILIKCHEQWIDSCFDDPEYKKVCSSFKTIVA